MKNESMSLWMSHSGMSSMKSMSLDEDELEAFLIVEDEEEDKN